MKAALPRTRNAQSQKDPQLCGHPVQAVNYPGYALRVSLDRSEYFFIAHIAAQCDWGIDAHITGLLITAVKVVLKILVGAGVNHPLALIQ